MKKLVSALLLVTLLTTTGYGFTWVPLGLVTDAEKLHDDNGNHICETEGCTSSHNTHMTGSNLPPRSRMRCYDEDGFLGNYKESACCSDETGGTHYYEIVGDDVLYECEE